MSEYWGYHLLVDLGGCDTALITSESNIRNFVKDLIDEIDMVAHGDAILEHFATHDPEKGGYTMLQMISTSSITGHFVDATGEAYLDVFSCKPFETDAAIAVIERYFDPKTIKEHFLLRKAFAV